ncbi:MAG: hypothetical protein LBE09_03355 [Christensenellaceae bacterium]|jgi:hypothetical protein|nr:hypothetical protein [Christensenellaceae bacterium]
MKRSLFALKTNEGYGLMHWFDSNVFGGAYLIYYNQISNLDQEHIEKSISDDYYYQRISDNLTRLDIYMKKLKRNLGVEFEIAKLVDFECPVKVYFDKCFLTYLGEYDLPVNASQPRFLKRLDFYYDRAEHEWVIYDTVKKCDLFIGNRLITYKSLTPEIADYPGFAYVYLTEILRRFNTNFRLSDYNDEYAKKFMEQRYQEEPELRPQKTKFDELKKLSPTKVWRKLDNKGEAYFQFCDMVEEAFNLYTSTLDENSKLAHKPLSTLLSQLNKINAKYPIGPLEGDDIYDYISNSLKIIEKEKLLKNVDDVRMWVKESDNI